MEYYKNLLCVSASWLVENDILTLDNYKALAKRKQIYVVRRASRNTPALVSYDSMPDRFKELVKEKIGGDPYEIVQLNLLDEYIAPSTEANNFFENYRLSDGRYLPKQTRIEYFNNARILDAIKRLIADKVAPKKVKGGKMSRTWESINKYVQALDRTVYPHTLPAYPARLRDRFNLYKKEGLESLIHKNFTNQHAAKVDDNVKESLIIELLGDPRNFDNERIARLYNQVAEGAGWQKITGHTIARYRDKYDLEIFSGRRGSVAMYNTKMMQAKRKAPQNPLYFWTLDGWDVELLYQKHNGKTITYHNRPTVVVVLDPCCKYPIGYAVGTHESPELIKAALRNAARHTSELFGKMYRTHQIQADRYAIKALTPLYAAMGKHVTPARAKNAKAKIIEPYFGYLNKTYCQLQPNWSGFGITSNKDKQPNIEFLNKYKKHFPDYDGVCAMVELIIEKERQEKRDEYLRLWAETKDENKIELSYESYLYHFGESTGRKNLMQGDGLHVTIKGIRQSFDCFDLAFRRFASTQWSVMYDPADTDRVLAINDDETLRFVLEKKHIQPMALKDRTDGDASELARMNRFNDEVVDYVTDFRGETGDTVREFLEDNPQLNGTLAKLVLTDSQGQHKNIRNIDAGRKSIEPSPADILKKQAEKRKAKPQDIYDLF
ncbi:hypothetical protein [Dysgonomonas sp. Marseille-P4361]|uniref:hypothetical protein n=1 Tax=Dysgonomonas sp. Marseille-P4361 TaxID=2161820 RepID=UPI001358EC03|nr:hypothetical protein [Dysgonomonas sp. Marseille-P4361]